MRKIFMEPLFTVSTDIFKFDPNFLENEQRYKDIKAEILGEDSSGEEESGSEEDSDEDEEDEEGVYICAPSFS